MTRVRAALAALLLAGALAGCADSDPAPNQPGTSDPGASQHPTGVDWPQVAQPRDGSGLAFWSAGTVHLPDGSRVRTDALTEFTLAGDGVWFVDDGPLRHATADGVEPYDVTPVRGTLHSSADGRYLAFLHRPDDVAVAVVVDLTTGEEVVASSRGMGDPDTDLDDLYEDAPPAVLGLVDEHAYVATTDETLRFDLTTGEAEVDDRDYADAPWYLASHPPDAHRNPAGTWSYDPAADRGEQALVSGDTEVTPRLAGPYADLGDFTVSLHGWLDDRRVVGLASADGLDDFRAVVVCRVPSGACTPRGTFGETVLPDDVQQGTTWVRSTD